MHALLAAGGTGGHLFPALALGQSFEAANHHVSYVGSGRPLDLHAEKLSGKTWRHLKAKRLKGVGFLSKLLGIFTVPLALIQALVILIQEKPDIVIGLGGYCTGPLVLMARFVGIKTAILEQNCIPGFTNRILSRVAHRIFVAFPALGKYWKHTRKIIHSGNPIRRDVINQFQNSPHDDQAFTLLVFGGSQGAHFLNETMLQLIPQLQQYKERVKLIHLTGPSDEAEVKAAYEKAGLTAEVAAFSDEMGRLYKAADLVISRAGASTVTDLIQFGRASVLIPYPFAADLHQHANGRYLAEAGAAVLIDQKDFSSELFWQQLASWLEKPEALQAMAHNTQSLLIKDPAQVIIKECEKFV